MGKGGTPKVKIGPLEVEQAQFLRQQRENVIEPVQGALMPAALPGAVQAFSTKLEAPDREAIEGQYSQLRKDIGASGARGGLLRRNMTLADQERARTVSNAAVMARQTGIARALGLLGPAAFPGAQAVTAAGGQLAGGEQSRAAQNAQLQAQSQGGLGSALGGLASLGGRFMMKG
jgi:hypothetical protein